MPPRQHSDINSSDNNDNKNEDKNRKKDQDSTSASYTFLLWRWFIGIYNLIAYYFPALRILGSTTEQSKANQPSEQQTASDQQKQTLYTLQERRFDEQVRRAEQQQQKSAAKSTSTRNHEEAEETPLSYTMNIDEISSLLFKLWERSPHYVQQPVGEGAKVLALLWESLLASATLAEFDLAVGPSNERIYSYWKEDARSCSSHQIAVFVSTHSGTCHRAYFAADPSRAAFRPCVDIQKPPYAPVVVDRRARDYSANDARFMQGNYTFTNECDLAVAKYQELPDRPQWMQSRHYESIVNEVRRTGNSLRSQPLAIIRTEFAHDVFSKYFPRYFKLRHSADVENVIDLLIDICVKHILKEQQRNQQQSSVSCRPLPTTTTTTTTTTARQLLETDRRQKQDQRAVLANNTQVKVEDIVTILFKSWKASPLSFPHHPNVAFLGLIVECALVDATLRGMEIVIGDQNQRVHSVQQLALDPAIASIRVYRSDRASFALDFEVEAAQLSPRLCDSKDQRVQNAAPNRPFVVDSSASDFNRPHLTRFSAYQHHFFACIPKTMMKQKIPDPPTALSGLDTMLCVQRARHIADDPSSTFGPNLVGYGENKPAYLSFALSSLFPDLFDKLSQKLESPQEYLDRAIGLLRARVTPADDLLRQRCEAELNSAIKMGMHRVLRTAGEDRMDDDLDDFSDCDPEKVANARKVARQRLNLTPMDQSAIPSVRRLMHEDARDRFD